MVVRDGGGGTNVVCVEAGGNVVCVGAKGKLEPEEGGSAGVVCAEAGIAAWYEDNS